MSALGYYAFMAWWAWAVARHYDITLTPLFQRPVRRRVWLLSLTGIVASVVSLSVLLLLLGGLSYLFPRIAERLLAPDAPDAAGPLGWTIALGIVGSSIVPIVEELFFRGVLLQIWLRRHGIRRAAIATSMIFAILHMDVLGAFAFGVVMTLLYVRTGSLLLPILAHVFNNAIASSAEFSASTEAVSPAELQAYVPVFAVALTAAVLVLWLVLRPGMAGWWQGARNSQALAPQVAPPTP